MPILIGALAHPALRMRLAPDAVKTAPLAGALQGGAMAGIMPDAFPARLPGSGEIPAWAAEWSPTLRRYAEIFGLVPQVIEGREILGLGNDQSKGAWLPELAGDMADWLLALPADRSVADLRHRLPMIAGWVASRRRAAQETAALPLIGPPGGQRMQIQSRREPYADYFSVESITLRQRRHRGDWSPDMVRAVFVSGDASVVLPWDPVRDRVMVIDQFRAGPVARGDLQPWLYEAIAGRVDPGELPEQAALREAVEETGLTLTRLVPGPQQYPSPGCVGEYVYSYIGIADLPDEVAGFGGLDSEDEDIRSHLMPRAELTRMAMAGEIRNGPLLSIALWLELAAAQIMAEPATV